MLAQIREDCRNTGFDWPSNSTDRSVPPERVIYSGNAIRHAAWHRAKLLKMLDAKQAKIDALMLEYCPDEMTDAQRAQWAKHQHPSDETSEQLVRGWYEAIKGMETSDMDAKLIAQRRVVDFERKLMSWAASHSEKVNSPLCPWCGGEHVGTDCKAEKANALGK